jgi:hypothetical protein
VSAHLRKVPDDLDQPNTKYENEAEENDQRRKNMHVLSPARTQHKAHKELIDANAANASEEIRPLFMSPLFSDGEIGWSHTRGNSAIARWYECMLREREIHIGRIWVGRSAASAYIHCHNLGLTIAFARSYPQRFSQK